MYQRKQKRLPLRLRRKNQHQRAASQKSNQDAESNKPRNPRQAEKLIAWREDLDYYKKSDEYYTDKRREFLAGGRVLVWFSCGATSAVAAKLAIQKYRGERQVEVIYCNTGGEHPSNKKFLKDVQEWLGQRVKVLKAKRYKDHWDVFRKERYLVGPQGAKCTAILKKSLRQRYEDPVRDIQVFGFSIEEVNRAESFRETNFEVYLETPLIDNGLDKGDCLTIIEEAGITLPFMYQPQKSGSPYPHNNCLGCVKGGSWYWNKIRIDFPEVFERMSKLEQELGAAVVRYKKKPCFLKDLPPDAGVPRAAANRECGVLCYDAVGLMEEDDEK